MKEVYFKNTPIGWLKIEALDGRIIGVDYQQETVKDDEADRPVSDVMKQCARELDEYFEGARTTFEVPVDFTLAGTPFQQRVWERLYKIPFGETISYKELAMDCGGPNHSRAVANANGRNPISIIVPCHRVIASDGTLGGYTGGIEKKQKLLGLEGRSL